MIWVDYCIVGVILLSAIVGALRGFTRETFSLLTWALAIGLSALAGGSVAELLKDSISIPALRVAAAFAGCFLGGLLLGALVSMLFVDMVKNSRLANADRTLGAGFGLMRGLVIAALFVMVAENMGARDENWWQRSKTVGKLTWLAAGLQVLVPEPWLQAIRPQNEEPAAGAAPKQED